MLSPEKTVNLHLGWAFTLLGGFCIGGGIWSIVFMRGFVDILGIPADPRFPVAYANTQNLGIAFIFGGFVLVVLGIFLIRSFLHSRARSESNKSAQRS